MLLVDKSAEHLRDKPRRGGKCKECFTPDDAAMYQGSKRPRDALNPAEAILRMSHRRDYEFRIVARKRQQPDRYQTGVSVELHYGEILECVGNVGRRLNESAPKTDALQSRAAHVRAKRRAKTEKRQHPPASKEPTERAASETSYDAQTMPIVSRDHIERERR